MDSSLISLPEGWEHGKENAKHRNLVFGTFSGGEYNNWLNMFMKDEINSFFFIHFIIFDFPKQQHNPIRQILSVLDVAVW